MQLALFIIFGLLAVAGAINFLLQRHPINSALSLIVVMMSLAVTSSQVSPKGFTKNVPSGCL